MDLEKCRTLHNKAVGYNMANGHNMDTALETDGYNMDSLLYFPPLSFVFPSYAARRTRVSEPFFMNNLTYSPDGFS